MNNYKYHAFSGFGIELEYMIVNQDTLHVAAIADKILGEAEDMDVPRGDAAWSNELALHVIETKTAGPIADLHHAAGIFRREVNAINELLTEYNARLMPTGMHPWMDPFSETKLWPNQNSEIYSTFDRIFDCRGHGWSNLQSMHINFPFASEEEFAKLHAAVRLVLPLLPAIAASSPFWNAARAPHLDQRLAVYQTNCLKVPQVTGQVIPEAVFSYHDYQQLLQSIYRGIAPYDPESILQEEWLNARGAIARFDRGAIEIRVLDTQECPEHDLSIAFFTTELVRAIYEGKLGNLSEAMAYSTEDLARQFHGCVKQGLACAIDAPYSRALCSDAKTARELFLDLMARLVPMQSPHRVALELILSEGNLAQRLVQTLAQTLDKSTQEPSPRQVRGVLEPMYRELCECLSSGRAYLPRVLA